MPIYEIEVNGQSYEVEAPDDATAEQEALKFSQTAPSGTSISAQPSRGPIDKLRNLLVGVASDKRIADQERDGSLDAGIGLNPRWQDLGDAALAGTAAGAIPAAAVATPIRLALGLLGGMAGGKVGASVARPAGEAIGPGVGDLTEPVGELVGGTVVGGVTGNLPTPSAATLKSAAARNLARMVGMKPADVDRVRTDVAADMIRKLGWGRRGTLEKVAKSESKSANERLSGIKDEFAEAPIPLDDLTTAAGKVRGVSTTQSYPKAAKRLTEEGGVTESMDPQSLNAAREAAKRIDKLVEGWAAGEGRPQTTFAPSRFAKLKGRTAVPAGEVFKSRTAAGRAAKAEYAKVPGTGAKASPTGAANKAVQGELSSTLQEFIPGLAKADLDSSSWALVAEALKRGTLNDILQKRPPTASVMGAKEFLTLPFAGINRGTTGYGTFQVARDILMSPLYQSLSARGKIWLADKIASGEFSRGPATKLNALLSGAMAARNEPDEADTQ